MFQICFFVEQWRWARFFKNETNDKRIASPTIVVAARSNNNNNNDDDDDNNK